MLNICTDEICEYLNILNLFFLYFKGTSSFLVSTYVCVDVLNSRLSYGEYQLGYTPL